MVRDRLRVTIADLAEAAGTSKAAVSYALNDQPGVSESTRHHILKTAERIGYHRGPARRSRRRTTAAGRPELGVALSPTRHRGETPNYYVAELLAGVEREAQRHDVQLNTQIWTPDFRPDRSRKADGMLFLGGAFDPDSLADIEPPAIIVGTSFPQLAIDSVLADNRQGAYLATTHLLDQGCRKLALINGPDHATTTSRKLTGFEDALHHRGIPRENAEVVQAEFAAEAGEAAARTLLSDSEPPDGIVAGDDVIAIGAMHAAFDLRLRVPEDVRITGFGDSPTASLIRPALSSVDVFLQQMGQIAVRRMLDLLGSDDTDLPSVRSLVSPRLVVRSSSGSAP